MKIKTGGIHYAWIILAGSILVAATTQGPIGVINSNLFAPVIADLGGEMNKLTMYVSISAITMALLYPLASKYLATKHIGKIIALGILIEASAYGLMYTYTEVWMFYISGVLTGIGGSIISFMAFPILINMWFSEKAGVSLGIIVASRGIGGAIFSPVFARLVAAFGWRKSCLIAMIVVMVISLPVSLIVFKRPQEMHMQPYGAAPDTISETGKGSSTDWGMDLRTGLRSPVFYLVWITGIFFSIAAGAPSYVASYSTMELGNPATLSATAFSALNVAGILCSLILGSINDRFGVKAGLLYGCSFQIAGCLLFIFCGHSIPLLMIGAVIFGLGNGMYHLQVPLLVRSVLGGKHYTEIWPILMLGNSLIGGGLFSSLALFYDKLGSYKYMFAFCILLTAIAFVLGTVAANKGKKTRETLIAAENKG